MCGLMGAFTAQAKTLTFCTEGSPETFAPGLSTHATSFDVTAQMYEGLVTFRTGTTEVVPALATRWTVSSDGLEYVFFLREGVKWQGNSIFQPTRDFNADDVLFTFERQWKKNHPYFAVTSDKHPYFNDTISMQLKSIEKLDDYAVKFTLTEPSAPFVSNLAMRWAGIQSAEYAQEMLKNRTPEKLDQLPIGTGPFQLVSYDKDQTVRYKSFDRYWAGRAKLDELVFAITPQSTQRWQKLQQNECQIIIHPHPNDLVAMREDRRMVVSSQIGLNVSYVSYNVKKKPFDDVRVRRALNMAIDKRRLLRAAYKHTAIPASNPIPPNLWSYNRELDDDVYDPEAAKKLLAQAGYPNGFHTHLWAMPVQRPYMPNAALLAKLLKEDWAEIGVNVTIQSPEWRDYIRDAHAGKHSMALYGWTGDNGDPDNFLNTMLGCDAVGGNNVSQFCDHDYDSLVKRAQTLQSREERSHLYEQAQLIFKTQVPWYTIAHVTQYKAMRREVVGFQMSPLGHHDFWGVDLLPER